MDGFVVVKSCATQEIIALPIKWIHEIEVHWEKFTNYGVNANQTFLAFYSDCPEAYEANGQPKPDFIPHFNQEGCFRVNLLKYKSKQNLFLMKPFFREIYEIYHAIAFSRQI